MKRWIHASTSLSGQELERQIEDLLDTEDIPFAYVECISEDDEDEIVIVVKTYGDWKNDNLRAHDIIVKRFNPDRHDWEQTDDDVEDYGLTPGSDSCVDRHEFIWRR